LQDCCECSPYEVGDIDETYPFMIWVDNYKCPNERYDYKKYV